MFPIRKHPRVLQRESDRPGWKKIRKSDSCQFQAWWLALVTQAPFSQPQNEAACPTLEGKYDALRGQGMGGLQQVVRLCHYNVHFPIPRHIWK